MSAIKKIELPLKITFRQLPSYLLIVMACILVGTVLLTSTFLLFPNITTRYIKESAYDFIGKSGWEDIFPYSYNVLDNYTDALILQISADNRDEGPLTRALLAYHGTNDASDGSPVDAIVSHYIENRDYDYPSDTYGRYWHGYILFLRPLLSIMSYSKIRILNAILQSLLAILIIFFLFQKKLNYCVIPFIVSLLLLNPILQSLCLQYSSCYYVFCFGTLIILLLSDNQLDNYYSYTFLLIGVLTSFFDFLTYPISTLGIPLVVYLCRIEKKDYGNLLICIFAWCIGYAGMWIGKWIAANIFTNEDVFSNALLGIQTRTSFFEQKVDYSLIDTLTKNIKYFFMSPMLFFFVLSCIIYFILFLKNKKQCSDMKLNYTVMYLVLCLLPIIWYTCTLNHSTIHAVYTNKSCIIISFSILCLLSRLSSRQQNKKSS